VPNKAEELVYDNPSPTRCVSEHPARPVLHLVEKNVYCVQVLYEAASAIFRDIDAVFSLTEAIRQIENEIDELERQLIREVFKIEERLSYQNLMHRIIRGICDISDKSQNVSERLAILAVKRQI
jgi:uncharacterized protein Yka (UPF0111/DUF47 family)